MIEFVPFKLSSLLNLFVCCNLLKNEEYMYYVLLTLKFVPSDVVIIILHMINNSISYIQVGYEFYLSNLIFKALLVSFKNYLGFW
jgi:hypothetical protein